jgi:AcrR family transcriptional regulator
MKCPSDQVCIVRCNNILNAAEKLIESQGIVSFNFSQLAKDVSCSTGTLYKHFKGKEDILVCLFLRNATSNHLHGFVEKFPELTKYQKVLLPVLFTFEAIERSKSFSTLRSISVNPMIWKLASDEKVERFKKRINAFWFWFSDSIASAIDSGELDATTEEASQLVQGIIFYLTGSLTQFESELIESKYLSDRKKTCYIHLEKLMAQYHWTVPLTKNDFEYLQRDVKKYFNTHYQYKMDCAACNSISNKL